MHNPNGSGLSILMYMAKQSQRPVQDVAATRVARIGRKPGA
jgi:hypothetical protein